MVVVLMGFSIRPELAGVTSFVRVLNLFPGFYENLLHLFHSTALNLDVLTVMWVRWCRTTFPSMRVGPYLACPADGIKIPKEGARMPAVKKLHQNSENNSKPPFIFGHSLQAMSLLVYARGGHTCAVPMAAPIHEGVAWSNRNKRTLLDKLVLLFLPIAKARDQPVILGADAYYGSRKITHPQLPLDVVMGRPRILMAGGRSRWKCL